jgi:hypothetical protein
MRLLGFVAGALALVLSSGANAQPWISYLGAEDRFAIWFPSEPTIAEIEWIDEDGESRSARRYSAERAGNTYSLIAVDYSDADDSVLRSSYAHAASVYRQKGEVIYDSEARIDRIDGRQLQITLDSGRSIYFSAYAHGDRLYILDAEISARAAPPGLFQQGLQIVDEEGLRVRYTNQGERIIRTDDLQDALGGADLDGPILQGASDEFIP